MAIKFLFDQEWGRRAILASPRISKLPTRQSAKEIDHARERIAAIERNLGITKKIAA